MANAHVVLLDSDLQKVALSVRLGRYAVAKIWQNIALSLLLKLVMIAVTLAGFASLWGAIVADLGAMLIVTLNSSLVLGQRRRAKTWSDHGREAALGEGVRGHGRGHAHGHGRGHGESAHGPGRCEVGGDC